MKVVEKFVSINGEGKRAGQLALFIRFAGCNLNCEYCDTKWANELDVDYQEYQVDELVDIIYDSGIDNITLTGGEPLLQKEMINLLCKLNENEKHSNLYIEIETNGSIDISPYIEKPLKNVHFTLDYKTSVSGMENKMCLSNFENVRAKDTVKFVVGSLADLEQAKSIIFQYKLIDKGCGIYFSPCFGAIEPAQMVDFLVKEKLNGVNIQLQLHKFIWDPDKRGV